VIDEILTSAQDKKADFVVPDVLCADCGTLRSLIWFRPHTSIVVCLSSARVDETALNFPSPDRREQRSSADRHWTDGKLT
jgi:hypothetical protein